jgi:polyphosphate kinase
MQLYLADNTHAWLLQEDGSYVPCQVQEGAELVDAQAILLERWSAHAVV